jgi:murein DD-endopeptidase MepM/ murein hydrolase activator NlpD
MNTRIQTAHRGRGLTLIAILAITAGTTACVAHEGEEPIEELEAESEDPEGDPDDLTELDDAELDDEALELAEDLDELSAELPGGIQLTNTELSQLLMNGNYAVTQDYLPNGVHAGIDFGGITNNVTQVKSPVNGTITANTAACGKVAVFDGANTIILAHMSNRTGLAVGSPVTMGTYLGTTSNVVGGGCTATGAHLHIEIRTGNNFSMAIPTNNNVATTLNPRTYSYPPFTAVTLTSPANNANVVGSPVQFSWQAKQGANSYRLQVSLTNAFTAETCTNGCVYNQAASSFSRSVPLNAATHYWRVRAGNSSQGGAWSVVRAFTRT